MKTLFILLCLLFLPVVLNADATYSYGGVFYYNGNLTTPDSLHVYVSYQPSGDTVSYKSLPDSAVWDTTIDTTDVVDNYAILNYHIYFGANLLVAQETISLRLDTSSVSPQIYALTGDSVKTAIEAQGSQLWGLSTFWGTLDSALMLFYPLDGTSPKDSVQITNSSGTVLMSIIYKHSNTNTVLDSTVVYHRVP